MPNTENRKFVGFRTSEARHEEIKRRAKNDGRSVSSWIDKRLDELFQLDDDRQAEARRTLSQFPRT